MAERLRNLRAEKGMGQNALAEALGVSNASISYWENGKQEPSVSAIYKLAVYFDVSVDYLLGRSEVTYLAANASGAEYHKLSRENKEKLDAYLQQLLSEQL